MSRDVVADFLTCIRNAYQVGKRFVSIPHSKFRFELAKEIKASGYITDCSVKVGEDGKKTIELHLRYLLGNPAISEITLISKQGRRRYMSSGDLKTGFKGGLGVYILSTNKGVMSDVKMRMLAKAQSTPLFGGEVLCSIW